MLPPNHMDAVRQQYQTDDMLRVRHETHAQYSVPRTDFPAWVLSFVHWRGDEVLLDVGCGIGHYFQPLQQMVPGVRYFGVDYSYGMLSKHPDPAHTSVGDAQTLPFASNTFDVVMANHMLYHVPDIDAALKEFRRVLKPEGILVTATNSIHTMPEFQVLFRRAIVLLSAPGSATPAQPPMPAHNLFALENGTRHLARNFYAVVRYDLPGAFVFPSIEPVMAYLESTRQLREPQLPRGVLWDDVMMIMRQQITHLINHFGELSVNKISGVLIASDKGGFIREYVEHLQRAHP
ncbi:MAG: class I SAM-dependent methyltransferase [Chloroflexi bacterium]|nr:class I SAM-dependent methyltransferase [Chloroflexota bacterium]